MKFECLKDKDSVRKAIQSFNVEFPSLKFRVNLELYSRKLAQYAYTVLMKDNDTEIGIAAVYTNDLDSKVAFITLIGVHVQFQKSGYGNILLQHCIEKAVNAGMEKI